MSDDLDRTMQERLAEHPDAVAALRAGDGTALENLLEVCTGAKIRSVTVRAPSSDVVKVTSYSLGGTGRTHQPTPSIIMARADVGW